jgi:PPOX class probable F420-dependent enzyme
MTTMVSPVLSASDRRLLEAARTATLATIDDRGRPRLVPCCFALDPDAPRIWTPIDEKPKRSADPRRLARVADLMAWPQVSLLVDRWSEDWSELAWLRLHGRGTLLEAGEPGAAEERRAATGALRARYPQYRDHDLEARPIIAIDVTEAIHWAASDG